jgi:hypothetical protein
LLFFDFTKFKSNFHADMALINSTVLPIKSIPMQLTGLNAVKQRGSCLVRCSSSVVENVRQNVASKSVRAQDLVAKYIEEAEARNGALKSFISIDKEGAMQQVKERMQACLSKEPLPATATKI